MSDSGRRFKQEARAASALNNPNIAHIYEIGEADGTNFIAMEYVEGHQLAAQISGRPLDLAQILDVGIQVADALEEAHAKGITHRDIKSANIIITARGRVKVLDFGLAKTASPVRQTPAEKANAQVKTRPGVVLGTISYMSPEQALGREVDTRTDIFSLGVVLYEMATGRLPFNGESVTETIDKIAHAQPDALARFNYDVPDELERIVRKALRKSRDERYQTATDLLVDLKSLKREIEFTAQSQGLSPNSSGSSGSKAAFNAIGASTGTPASRQTEAATTHPTSSAEYLVGEIKRHKLGATLTALIVIAAIVAIPVALKRFVWSGQSAATATAKPMKSKRLVTSATGGKVGNTSISPDGRFVVYKDDEADRRQGLWLRQVATGATRQIVAPDEVAYRGTTFSRDGNLVYYVVRGPKYPSCALFQVPIIGGTPKQLPVNISGSVTLSPDGSQMAFVHEKNLMVANADGTASHQVASLYWSLYTAWHGPAWSPDGKTIAYGSMQANGDPNFSVFTVAVATGEVKQVTTHKWGAVRRVVWLGDGRGLIILACEPDQDFSQIWEVSYPDGAVRRITNDLNGHGYVSLGLTADSQTLVTQQEDDISNVWIVANGDSKNARQLTSNEGRTDGRFGLSWTLDGRLIYSSRMEIGWDLWKIKVDGTGQEHVTTDAYREDLPAVTPDGQTIVFESNRDGGSYHIWKMSLDGSQLKQLTRGENTDDHGGRATPDGKWVVYSVRGNRQERLWKVPMEGGTPVQITDYQSSLPDVSPDGKFIVCGFFDQNANPARWRVAIIPFAGGAPLKTLDLPLTADLSRTNIDAWAANYVRWLPGGRSVAYVDSQNGVSNIWERPIDGGPAKQLTDFKSGLIFNFDISPDGKQIACARGARTSDVILITDFR